MKEIDVRTPRVVEPPPCTVYRSSCNTRCSLFWWVQGSVQSGVRDTHGPKIDNSSFEWWGHQPAVPYFIPEALAGAISCRVE